MKAPALSAKHPTSFGLADLAGAARGLLYAGPVRFLAIWASVITHLGFLFLAPYLCSRMVNWCFPGREKWRDPDRP